MAANRGAPKTHSQRRGAQYKRDNALEKEADSNQPAAAKPKTLKPASDGVDITTSSNSRKRKTGHEHEESKKPAQKRHKPEPRRTKPKRTRAAHKRKNTSTKAPTLVADADAALNKGPPSEPVTVYVFGGGENGELGLGPKQTTAARPRKNPFLDPSQTSTLHVVDIACGGMHTVALTTDNKVVTWGVNDNEALGRNTQWDGGLRDVDDESDDSESQLNPFESTPTAISSEHFGVGTRLVGVAAGDSCSLALTSTGLVYGWGTFRDPEGKESFGYSGTGGVIQKQPTPMRIQGLEKITQIACGANHALALDTAGNIWGWGSGHQSQLGRRLPDGEQEQDTLKPRVIRVCEAGIKYIACGEYHCFAIDNKDHVWGWGLNSYGQAGDTKTAGGDEALLSQPVKIPALCGKGVTMLAGGAHHSVAVTSSGECLVWGRLDGGQLGLKLSEEQIADEKQIRCDERGKPRICLVPKVVSGLGTVSHAACGTDHTLFINKDGHAFATGFGSEGQLGLGSDDDANVAQQIQGKHIKDQIISWAGAGGQFSMISAKAA